MLTENKYLTSGQLAALYPYNPNTLRNILCRAELAPYRNEEKRTIKILHCDETQKLIEHFIKIKQIKRGRRDEINRKRN